MSVVPSAKPKYVRKTCYRYVDAAGVLQYTRIRCDLEGGGKNFLWCRPNPEWKQGDDPKGQVIWNAQGVQRVLYRLPEVLKAVKERLLVVIVEGEGKADLLADIGLAATCCPDGAGKWHVGEPDYNAALRGAIVAILPDNDQAGYEHAFAVAKSLMNVALSVKVVPLPGVPAKGDVKEWLAAQGADKKLTRERLMQLINLWPIWQPSVPTAITEAHVGRLMIQLVTDEINRVAKSTVNHMRD